jgi:hypothetical protein
MIQWWLTPVEFVPEAAGGQSIPQRGLLRRASLCATLFELR